MNIRKGSCYLAALDPAIGREIPKTRPVVVVSNNKNNEFSETVTILPVTSKHIKEIYPFEVLLTKGIGNLPKDSRVKADKIRELDKRWIVKFIGTLEKGKIHRIDEAMRIHLALF